MISQNKSIPRCKTEVTTEDAFAVCFFEVQSTESTKISLLTNRLKRSYIFYIHKNQLKPPWLRWEISPIAAILFFVELKYAFCASKRKIKNFLLPILGLKSGFLDIFLFLFFLLVESIALISFLLCKKKTKGVMSFDYFSRQNRKQKPSM